MKLRTDDEIYRARLVYLGPPGYSLPWQWTYARYGLFLAVSAVFLGVVLLVTGFHLRLVPDVFAVAAAVVVSNVVWRHVDPDRPARAVVRTVLTDWRAYPQPTDEHVALPPLSARHITIKEHL